ncbi:MAG: PilZ domain-containing protein [Candidatus Omnitrophica bacterium]|nr:PilZ domain-containing protein [Candidatus Omnitrophota bacterium]
MEIKIRTTKDTAILDLRGNLDVNASNFIEAIGEVLRQGFKKVICNFKDVDIIDYMGLSGLAIAYKNISNHDAVLKLSDVPTHIKSVFSLLLLDNVLEICGTEAEALKNFQYDDSFSKIESKKLRRRFKRLPINLKIKFRRKFSSSKDFLEGKIFNISAIGVFIYTKKTFELNDILRCRILLGAEKETIEFDARVVWLADKRLQPQIAPGMAVEFYKMPSRIQKKIVEFVDKNISHARDIDT